MYKLVLIQFAVGIAFMLLRNLRALLWIVALSVVGCFVYFLVESNMNIEFAFDKTLYYVKFVINWIHVKGVWVWDYVRSFFK